VSAGGLLGNNRRYAGWLLLSGGRCGRRVAAILFILIGAQLIGPRIVGIRLIGIICRSAERGVLVVRRWLPFFQAGFLGFTFRRLRGRPG
jgi:hypothetical protein